MKKVSYLLIIFLVAGQINANAQKSNGDLSNPAYGTFSGTASTNYNINYLSGTASYQYGAVVPPYYDASSIKVYCQQYGGYLPNLTHISSSPDPGLYYDKWVASSSDGVYSVYFSVYGQTNGNSGNIEVTDTEYIPAFE